MLEIPWPTTDTLQKLILLPYRICGEELQFREPEAPQGTADKCAGCNVIGSRGGISTSGTPWTVTGLMERGCASCTALRSSSAGPSLAIAVLQRAHTTRIDCSSRKLFSDQQV
nr:hypothetical protein CFP56_11307 [Quercus suber]